MTKILIDEATVKQALEALEKYCTPYKDGTHPADEAITDLRQALANEALDKMAENARDLGIQMQPAHQQEPICKLFGTLPVYDRAAQQEPFTHYRHYDNGLQDWADEKTIPLYTSPPAQRKPWVGLTDEDVMSIVFNFDVSSLSLVAKAIEAKLKEKNA